MLSFFSLEDEYNKLAIKEFSSHIHSPTTVVRQHSPVDLIAQLECFMQEHFTKITQLGNLFFQNQPNLIQRLCDSIDKMERIKAKIKDISSIINKNQHMFHLVSHLNDDHRHCILEFFEKNPKFISQYMFIVNLAPSEMHDYIQENLNQLSQIEIDILNQPYEFRLWLFNLLKKEINQSSANDSFKELLSKQFKESLALKQQYLRLYTTNIKKAVTEIKNLQICLDDLFLKEKKAIHQFRQSILPSIASQYQSLNELEFEFAAFQDVNSMNKELSTPIIEKIKELQNQCRFNARFDFFSPVEPTPVSKSNNDEPVEEWGFFDDLSPHFSMMILETLNHGTFIDNDIFKYLLATGYFHAPQPAKKSVYKENCIFQVYHSAVTDAQLTSFKTV